jgi:hypothetical protein
LRLYKHADIIVQPLLSLQNKEAGLKAERSIHLNFYIIFIHDILWMYIYK